MTLNRRRLLAAGLTLPLAMPAIRARAAAGKTLRMGFQKGEPVLMAAKQNQDLEKLLAPLAWTVEWIEFQTASACAQRVLGPAHGSQKMGVPVVAHRIVCIEFEGGPELRFGQSPVPVMVGRAVRQCRMRLSQSNVEFQCLACGGLRFDAIDIGHLFPPLV